MSYIKPSVLVYQDLVNSGGVLNSTPDLETCIIGPLNTVLTYVPGSLASQVKTAAYSNTSTTGTVAAGSPAVTVASTGGFNVGDSVLVVGAGDSGSTLQANVLSIVGNVITLDANALTAVTEGKVTKSGKIANAAVNNTFELPGQKPGQIINESSIQVWLNNTKVETLVTGCEGFFLDNTLAVETPATTGSITAASSSLTVASPVGFVIGDTITVAGAGAAASTLTTKILNIVGSVFTVSPAAGTTANTQAVTKVAPVNLNSTTNTLKVEAGDEVVVSYTNSSGNPATLESAVLTVVTTSGLNGAITSLDLVDMLPSDVSTQTTGNINSGSPTLTLTSATGFAVGSKVLVRGAGAAGGDLVATINTLVGTTATLSVSAGTSVTGAPVIESNHLSISVRKTYNNQQLPSVKPLTGGASYDTSNAGTLGEVTVNSGPELVYGPVVSADVYFGYTALRTDLGDRVLTINDADDARGQLEDLTDANPMGLAVLLALANTTTRVRAITVASDDLAGYESALTVAEGERLYYLTPLTQDEAILAAFQAHVEQMSTPENASWRVALVNTVIPTTQNIGPWSEDFVNANGGNNNITIVSGNYVLTSSNSTFISDGVTAGDIVRITASTPSTQVGGHQVLTVVSNQQLIISATATATAVSFYVERSMSKTQSAQAIKAKSENFGSNRVWHIQPDIVGVSINGVIKYLPGYYLAAGHSGMGAGFPVQQGFTNIGVAGISDLKNSNFSFSKADLNSMAEGGTCLYVQDTQGGIPYCRHELTTDVSVLEYREQLVVKNWDFLSYFYYDKLKAFIGSWNITPDTINTIRQTITAASELVKSKKLPKIGAPLLGYTINKLEQNPFNKDNLDVDLNITIVYPLNYLNLHLII